MLTVLEVINLSSEYLKRKGIDESRLNAELLLADILHCKRLELYLSFDRPLAQRELDEYRDYIKRRGNFEPLQYITGKVEFYGLQFFVSKDVLIPRPETEILIEAILKDSSLNNFIRILDIGTGSGNIAIALTKNIVLSSCVALDVSEQSLQVAKKNAHYNEVSDKIKFIKADIFDNNLNLNEKYDLIVSNPPYVSHEEFLTLQKEIINFEPHNAVTDYEDGLKFYKRISCLSKTLLKPRGKLFFEVGKEQSESIKNILLQESYSEIKSWKDYLGIDRVIKGELI